MAFEQNRLRGQGFGGADVGAIGAAARNRVLRNTYWLLALSMIPTVLGAYNISKAADLQLVRNLAAEFGSKGVRVNAIAPGLVRTDFARTLWENPEILKRVTSVAALKRIGEPKELAGAAIFLASDAASFVTGQTLIVDGGSTFGAGL